LDRYLLGVKIKAVIGQKVDISSAPSTIARLLLNGISVK